jgi:transcriptional regulator with XRE-family HTH domain
MVTFGSVVRGWRIAGNLSGKALATQLGISEQYLNDIERDRRNPPKDAIIELIAEALGGPTDFFYYAADRLPPDCRGFNVLASTVVVGFERLRTTLHEED